MVETVVIKKSDCVCTAPNCDRNGGCTYCLGLDPTTPCPEASK